MAALLGRGVLSLAPARRLQRLPQQAARGPQPVPSACSARSLSALGPPRQITRRAAPRQAGPRVLVRAQAEEKDEKIPFGNTRQDVLIIGGIVLGGGFGAYYAAIAAGVDPLIAGNIIQLIFVLGLMVAWSASYVLRVVNKDMTYAKQLDAYEEAVMMKRLEELPEGELSKLMDEVEEEKVRREAAGKQRPPRP